MAKDPLRDPKGTKTGGQFTSQIGDEEISDAVHEYTGSEHARINAALRNGEDLSSDPIVRRLDEMVRRASLTEDLTFFRGVRREGKQFFEKLKPGDTVLDRGFMSVSLDREVALGKFARGYKPTADTRDIFLEISAPKGSKFASVDPYVKSDAYRYEKEYIGARGTRLRLRSKKDNVYKFEVVSDGPDQE